MIAIWGARQAGKTVFLGSIPYALPQGWIFQGVGQGERNFLVDSATRFAEQIWPERTMPPDSSIAGQIPVDDRVFKFNLRVLRRRDALGKFRAIFSFFGIADSFGVSTEPIDIAIDFLDPSGEIFSRPGHYPDLERMVFDLISKSKGIIMLISPDDTDRIMHFTTLINSLSSIATLRNPDKERVVKFIDVPVALCMTKMDQHGHRSNDVNAFAMDVLGRQNIHLIDQFLINYKWFGISSMGFGNVGLNDDKKTIPLNSPQPVNVLEALRWIIDRMAE